MAKQSNKKQEWFRQCTFTSPTEDGEVVHIAWIQEKFAVTGKVVYFGKKTDTPDRLWTVTTVGGRSDGAYLQAHERDYLTQRQASDI